MIRDYVFDQELGHKGRCGLKSVLSSNKTLDGGKIWEKETSTKIDNVDFLQC